jgi:Zn-dependent protease with chaperone function
MEMSAMAEAVRWMEGAFLAFAQVAGPVFVAALWQGAVLAVGLALSLRVMPRISAADRFRAWAAGFAALVALPFLPFLLAALRSGAAGPASVDPGGPAHAWLDLNPHWTLAIAAVWILVAFYRVADLAVHSLRLRRLWKQASPAAVEGAPCQVCTTRELDRPSVIGFFRPRILIPEWLFDKLTPAELEQVVLHESQHLRRRDDWTNLLQKLALAAFPLHPALAWMERRLCREREMACDEAVVRATEKPRTYAACLASLAERGLERDLEQRAGAHAAALTLGAWRQRPELAERVHRILRMRPGVQPAAARALLGVLGCGLLFSSVELARSPQVVAFVSPAPPETAAADAVPAAMVQTAYAADRMSDFHAMDAMVRTPETVEGRAAKSPRSSSSLSPLEPSSAAAPERHRVAANRRSVARVVAVKAPAGDTPAGETLTAEAPAPRQWVVFSAWEQVETVARPALRNGAAEDRTASAEGNRSAAHAPVAGQIILTRLVVIYPADATQANADAARAKAVSTGSKAGLPSSFVTGLPAAIPLRDGWLVFQL